MEMPQINKAVCLAERKVVCLAAGRCVWLFRFAYCTKCNMPDPTVHVVMYLYTETMILLVL